MIFSGILGKLVGGKSLSVAGGFAVGAKKSFFPDAFSLVVYVKDAFMI